MKKINKTEYRNIKNQYIKNVYLGLHPSLKEKKRSRERLSWLTGLADTYNVHINTIYRILKSKNYKEYLRLGNENRGNSKRKPRTPTWQDTIDAELKPAKKYKTTIISTRYIPPFLPEKGIESYTVEVIECLN